jgi:ABC-2 type transport system permease protein
MAALLLAPLKSWTRVTSFIGKEVVEVVRRPGALLSLVVGPFLIMALFGVGYSGQPRPLDTVIVVPPGSGLPTDPAFYQQYAGPAITVTRVTPDLEAAREQLTGRRVDLVVVTPQDPEQQFLDGRQSAIGIEFDQTDPVRDNYARFVADRQVQELNKAILERVIGEGRQVVMSQTGTDPIRISPEVIAAPTRPETRNLAPVTPSVVAYFAPAVLALILQHMGVTLASLSMIRERLGGAIDIFRVAPVRTLEILIGKYLAFAFFNVAVATAVSLLLIHVLGIPMLGDARTLGTVILLLTFASLGLGLLISTVVDSERQAVQLSMLVLLASVFFSGFVLPLDEFIPAARFFSYALPVTHGIQLLQEVMLRGAASSVWELWLLLAIGAILFLITTFTLQRSLSRAI